ncbi:hypothetical protein MYCTH_2119721 [Thermothelomyces thermophilus ATCC 42464]|uniref:Cellobiose dehydrogenase-like cytochrome domain-containing protein n=1 Tax=Thermothelomyces thermophilus (strain ATCC 42464 / BCRC 31852 / DSM 1799) TaxID=573729 RepID=G2QII8_THET4|nr:uncharacterized protein MYCTH_2119721 [Thermothelomyces thermophilus ATCC 42464]AEO59519.1 hypothetical protein MYCTH_2119721 [Thermothelomyces thermophilus ATCC 42464]
MRTAIANVFSFCLVLLLGSLRGGHAFATAPAPALDKRQSTSRYCSPSTQICYLEYSWGPTIPVFRIAVPDSASTNTDFQTLLQIVAPASLGWAGFSWGGGMTLNPLTVAWPNGSGGATVSSRWATGRSLPTVYSSATYRIISAETNSTHWTVETVCSGCSRWNGSALSTTAVNTFAWAVSKSPVSQPADSSSSFQIHDNIGTFAASLNDAKVPKATFDQYVQGAQ